MPTDILTLERICADGWPGLRSRVDGDWIARFGNGFTNRANSVLVLGAPAVPVDTAVERMWEWYGTFGRSPAFQLPTGPDLPVAVAAVDTHLRAGGWQPGDQVSVQVARVDDVLAATDNDDITAMTSAVPDPDWLALYLYRGKPLPPTAVEVLAAGPGPTFLTVCRGGQPVGVGRGIVTHGWLGITAVTVAEHARRSGVGTTVMTALLRWGRSNGAHSAYLQVDRANTVALTMYERMGFTEHHGYHYLLAPAGGSR